MKVLKAEWNADDADKGDSRGLNYNILMGSFRIRNYSGGESPYHHSIYDSTAARDNPKSLKIKIRNKNGKY